MQATAGRSYRRMFLILALLGFGVDQASKYGVFGYLYNEGQGDRIVVIDDHFHIEAGYTTFKDPGDRPLSWLRTLSGEHLPHLNHGALWGIGGRNDEGRDGNHLFMLVSLVAAIGILIWSSRAAPAADRFLMLALGLILAGTLGNLFDRVVFGGVRDFLHFFNLHWPFLRDANGSAYPLPMGLHNWPVFNIADCCLVSGAGLLVLQAFFAQPAPTPAPEQPAAAPSHETAPVARV